MITRYPFTAVGFKARQKELYALPQTTIQAAAAAIRFALRNWVNAQFLMEDSQSGYLKKLAEPIVNFD